MTKSALAALVIAIAPVAAHAAVVVPPTPAPADGFSLVGLIDGTDHILASIDDRPAPPPNPFGTGAVAFTSNDLVAKPGSSAVRARAVYGPADAAAQEPLPEPTTWLMMILGFFGLSFAVRRRSSATGDRVRFS